MKKWIKELILFLYAVMRKVLPVNKKIILYESNSGRNYSGNPRYIYEEIVAEGLDNEYKCVWILENTDIKIPGNVKKIKRSRMKYYYYFSIAGFWVFDNRQPDFIKKRSSVTYIQTWHGTPLKKLGLDMDKVVMESDKDIKKYHDKFIENSSSWDYLISQNEFSTNIFRRCFAFKKDILEIGYPRNDILVREKDNSAFWKEKLGIPSDKKVILYAPTWRDDQIIGKGKYSFKLDLDLDLMKERLGDEYVVLLRTHHYVAEAIDVSHLEGFVYNVCDYDDISELYLISDICITDYSSVFFDYANLKRPILFYVYDFDKYKDQLRGFYIDMNSEVPGPLLYTSEEVIQSIENIDQVSETYKERYEQFYNRFCCYDDGNASENVAKELLEKE